MRPIKFAALAAALLFTIATSLPAAAHKGIHIHDPYARVIGANGVVFLLIDNHEDADDILLSASSPVAGMAMLMNDTEDANGVMHMRDVPEGFTVKAGQSRLLTNVADHVMLSDLSQKPKPGDTLQLTLTFLHAGAVTVTVPVDNLRTTDPGMGPTPYDAKSAAVEPGTADTTAPAHDMGTMDMSAKPAP